MSADIIPLSSDVKALPIPCRHAVMTDDMLAIQRGLKAQGFSVEYPHATVDGFALYVEHADGRRFRLRIEGTSANARPGTCFVLQHPADLDQPTPDGAA